MKDANSKEIQLGDVVTLRSGGVRMTVVRLNEGIEEETFLAGERKTTKEEDSVVCHWTESHQIKMNTYPPKCLVVL